MKLSISLTIIDDFLYSLAQSDISTAKRFVWSSNNDNPYTGKLEISYGMIDIIHNH